MLTNAFGLCSRLAFIDRGEILDKKIVELEALERLNRLSQKDRNRLRELQLSILTNGPPGRVKKISNFSEFKQKYGRRYASILISEYVLRSPEFDGDIELAKRLGELIADLETIMDDR